MLAGLALSVMPLAMWLANRSAPLCLGISAMGCLVVAWCEGWPRQDRLRIMRALCSPSGIALAAFTVLAGISVLWSHKPSASLFALGEMLVPLISGVVVAIVLPPRAPAWMVFALAASLALSLLLTVVELRIGMDLRGAAGLRAMTFTFNRSLICVMLLAIPLFGWLVLRRRLAWAAGIGGAVLVAVMLSESGAARLGLMVGCAAALAAWRAPRLSLLAAATSLVAMMAFAPVQGGIADRLIPASAHTRLRDSHSRDRVDIWISFGEAIRARPWLGSGFGTSATLHENGVAGAVSPQRRPMLAVGHPHSSQVQVWVETGVAGAGLILIAALCLVMAISRRKRRAIIAPLAALATAVSIAAVGHGAWQGWWIATLAATIVWFRVFDAMKILPEPKRHESRPLAPQGDFKP